MKTNIYTSAVFFLIFIQSVNAQNCTQCDNTSNPPGNYASETGINTTAQGEASFAGGYGSQALGNLSFAFGNQSIANGTSSVVLGRFLQTTTSPAMVIGTGAGLNDNMLTNGIPNSLMIGFDSNKPTFFVNSGGPGNTGKVGIGNVTNPLSKLHIKADENESAEVFIEPYQFGGSNFAYLYLGTKDYGLKAMYGKLVFQTDTNGYYVFDDGKVGIGTFTPTEKLEVKGNIKINTGYLISDKLQSTGTKGLMLYNGMGSGINISGTGNVGIGVAIPTEKLEVNGKVKSGGLQVTTGYGSGKLLQSDGSGNAVWTNPAWTITPSGIWQLSLNVGIGTTSPAEKLDVIGTVKASTLKSGNLVITTNPGNGKLIQSDAAGNASWVDPAWINDANIYNLSKNIGIGISTPAEKLHVNGNIKGSGNITIEGKLECTEIEVVNVSDWKDDVFDPAYKLKSIGELKAFIDQNRHLPEVPSEAEVKENGLKLLETNKLLLQKIEELTLYIIQLNEEIAKMRKDNIAETKN